VSTIAPVSGVCPPLGERHVPAGPRRRSSSSPLLTSDESILVPSLHAAGLVTRKQRLRENAVPIAELSAKIAQVGAGVTAASPHRRADWRKGLGARQKRGDEWLSARAQMMIHQMQYAVVYR
jgi:hypothetical protein